MRATCGACEGMGAFVRAAAGRRRDARGLELASGTGTFLREMRERGFKIVGVDPRIANDARSGGGFGGERRGDGGVVAALAVPTSVFRLRRRVRAVREDGDEGDERKRRSGDKRSHARGEERGDDGVRAGEDARRWEPGGRRRRNVSNEAVVDGYVLRARLGRGQRGISKAHNERRFVVETTRPSLVRVEAREEGEKTRLVRVLCSARQRRRVVLRRPRTSERAERGQGVLEIARTATTPKTARLGRSGLGSSSCNYRLLYVENYI